jgi:glutathione S-transferase
MKLYYSPFACSFASHVACREAGLPVQLERTELTSKRVQGGVDLFSINPMGQVPTLITDDGQMLTENIAVLSYLADRAPSAGLAPARDGFARYELTRCLSFIATELHKKGLALIFAPDTPGPVKDFARGAIHKPLAVAEAQLSARGVLIGEHFSVADAYLIWALMLMRHANISLDAYPGLRNYHKRHMVRPAVQAALAVEREEGARPLDA